MERLERERLERERKRKEEDEIYASRVKREREEEAKKEKLLRASDLKRRLEAEEAKKKSLAPPVEKPSPPKPEENMKVQKPLNNIRSVSKISGIGRPLANIFLIGLFETNKSRSSSMSTIIGFNSDNEYGGRYAGKVKTLPPYNPPYNPIHPIEDMKSRNKNEPNIIQTTEAQTETVNFDMNPTYKTFATKDIGVSPIATITPQFKEFDDRSFRRSHAGIILNDVPLIRIHNLYKRVEHDRFGHGLCTENHKILRRSSKIVLRCFQLDFTSFF